MKVDSLKKDFFKLSTGREIAYCSLPGHGIPLIFLNGLGDAMESWIGVLNLVETERPCLLVDLPGQGASLERDFAQGEGRDYSLSVEEQAQALTELLSHLRVDRYGIVGFSYGGGVALGLVNQNPSAIEDVILLLPFILRLDLSFPLSRLWVAQFEFLKSLTPKGLRQPFDILEKSYERFIEHYMNYRYLGRIPDVERRRVAVELSRGIMEFNSFKVVPHLPSKRLVLLTSGMDTLVPQSLYQEFWYRIPKDRKRAWVHVLDGEHLIVEQSAPFVAHFLSRALQGELTGEHKVSLRDFARRPTFSPATT